MIKQVKHTPGSRPIKIWTDTVEEQAAEQLSNLAQLPFIHPNGVAVMPDVHAGRGSTVGTVIATMNAIIPAAVGVDIGCGMIAVCLEGLTASHFDATTVDRIFAQIERDVPLGTGGRHQRALDLERIGMRKGTSDSYVTSIINRNSAWASLSLIFKDDFSAVLTKSAPQLGTLGSGNHFIELCLDEQQRVWLMLHSGSRGIGNIIGSYYIEKAKREMERWFIHLPDTDLSYLPEGSQYFDHYLNVVSFAQDYAATNRQVMLNLVVAAIRRHLPIEFTMRAEAINCHHNYVERENHYGRNAWVTRKGAIRAREGDMGIIPGSMGTRSYIVRGLGNPESYNSCSHGAGRIMSRAKANSSFTLDQLAQQTEGVKCRKDASVLDEIPGAYKDIDEVMANQAGDLVEVVHSLKQFMCVKGG